MKKENDEAQNQNKWNIKKNIKEFIKTAFNKNNIK